MATPTNKAPQAEQSADAAVAAPPSLEQQMALFLSRMEERMSRSEQEQQQRLAALEQRVEQRVAEMSAATEQAGLIPPPAAHPNYVTPDQARPPSADELEAARNAQRQVAFIPKDDPLNASSRSFDAWCNGRLIRIRRGEIGMVSLGLGIDLAKGGHGHVIDLAAMQQVRVQPHPDYQTPDDAYPASYERVGSSVPRDFYAKAG